MLYNIIDHIALPNIGILIYDTDLLILIKNINLPQFTYLLPAKKILDLA